MMHARIHAFMHAGLPEEPSRNAVVVLSWITCGCFGIASLVYLISAVKCLADCLCCCCDKKEDSYKA